jgi:hypothetical protein
MSEVKSSTCDGCGQLAPDGYSGGFMARRYGWISFMPPRVKTIDDIDFCSWQCLVDYAVTQPGVKMPTRKSMAAKARKPPPPVDQLAARRKRA